MLPDNDFPHGVDYDWIASDNAGRLAIFTNAGEGPIPSSALTGLDDMASTISRMIADMPELCVGEMLISYPNSDSFIELGKRGFFVYDWQLSNKSKHDPQYAVVCTPSAPIGIGDLGDALREFAQKTCFSALQFENGNTIDPTRYFTCVER